MTTWTNETKPSVYKPGLWVSTMHLWDDSDPLYVTYPWQIVLDSIWTNDSK